MQSIEPIPEYYWQYVCVGVLLRMESQGLRAHEDREDRPRGIVGMSSALKKIGHTVKDAKGSVRKSNIKKDGHGLHNKDVSSEIDEWVRW